MQRCRQSEAAAADAVGHRLGQQGIRRGDRERRRPGSSLRARERVLSGLLSAPSARRAAAPDAAVSLPSAAGRSARPC